MEFVNDWDFSLGADEDEEFCLDVCSDMVNADADSIFDCGCVFQDEDEGDNRSDFEQAGEWLASAGWGTDEDYGSYGGDEW